MNKKELVEDFKTYLISYYNDNVYEEMQSYLSQIDIDDEEYRDTLDYMCREMTGSIGWIENK